MLPASEMHRCILGSHRCGCWIIVSKSKERLAPWPELSGPELVQSHRLRWNIDHAVWDSTWTPVTSFHDFTPQCKSNNKDQKDRLKASPWSITCKRWPGNGNLPQVVKIPHFTVTNRKNNNLRNRKAKVTQSVSWFHKLQHMSGAGRHRWLWAVSEDEECLSEQEPACSLGLGLGLGASTGK